MEATGTATAESRASPRRRRLGLLAVWAVYAGLTAIVAMHHEPWRDEADVWLQVRDRTALELWQLMPYSGTPGLWHALIFPFARLGAPYATQFVIHWLIAVSAVGVLLFRAPFHAATRILVSFTFLLGYEYVVVARSYALTVAGLFAAAALFSSRRERPWVFGCVVAATANSNVIGMFAGGALCAVLGLDVVAALRARAAVREAGTSFLVAAAGTLLALTQVIPPADGQFTRLVERFEIDAYWRAMQAVFFPTGPLWLGSAVAVLIVAGACIRVWRSPRAIVFILLCHVQLFYLIGCKYSGAMRHHGFLLVTLVAGLWIGIDEAGAKPPQGVTRVPLFVLGAILWASLALSCWRAGDTWRLEIARPFSNSETVARYLIANGLVSRTIAAFRAPPAAAVLPYLDGVRFYYPSYRAFGTHMWWNRDHLEANRVGVFEAVQRVKQAFPDWGDAERGPLLLLSLPLANPEAQGYRLLYQPPDTPFFATDEAYFLYLPIG